MTYQEFLDNKAIVDVPTGFKCKESIIPKQMLEFQKDILRWQCRRGRSAEFADCGMMKTLNQLAFAQQVVEETNKPFILFAPLSVAQQTKREGEKFGIEVNHVRFQSEVKVGVNVTNYDKLHKFDARDFSGVGLDESGILKSFDGSTKQELIEAFKKTPYKGAYTATPAPNDFMELGNHAEFLGVMSRTEMLATFFVHDGGDTSKWRLKRHAQEDFWKWLCSWAVNIRKPSDLGYDDKGFKLPKLNMFEHIVESNQKMDGYLFPMPASTLSERREARRESTCERVELCVKLITNELQKVLSGTRRGIEGEVPQVVSRQQIKSEISKEGEAISEKVLQGEQNKMEAFAGAASENKCEATGEIQNGRKLPKRTKKNSKSISDSKSRKGEASEDVQQVRSDAGAGSGGHEKSGRKMRDLRLEKNGQPSEISIHRPLPQDGKVSGDAMLKLQPCNRPPDGQSKVCSSSVQLPSEKWLVWCQLNAEQDALAEAFGDMCVSIQGSTPEVKREELEAEWHYGKTPILISKPLIFGFGMNWQHCNNVVFVGLSDSYETFYQSVRRCWRFGQLKDVNIHVIISSLEGAVLSNIKRKEADAKRLADSMIKNMADISSLEIKGQQRETITYNPQQEIILPKFL